MDFLLDDMNFVSKLFFLDGFDCSKTKMRISQYDLSKGSTAQDFRLDSIELLNKVECG